MRSVGRAVRYAPRGWRAVSSCPEIVASLDNHIIGQAEAKRVHATSAHHYTHALHDVTNP